MSRTVRRLPPGHWMPEIPRYKLELGLKSGVRCCKGDRGDGRPKGWAESETPGRKELGKKLAHRMMRRYGAKLSKEDLWTRP